MFCARSATGTPASALRLLASILLLLGASALSGRSAAERWEPVRSEDLQAAPAAEDSSADAMALLWQIRIEDAWDGSFIYSDRSEHRRIKIFNERGAQENAAIGLPYDSDSQLLDFQARLIRPDGTTLEIKKSSVFDRVAIKTGGVKIREKRFAVPDLKPGSIIEYRWAVRRYYALANYLRIELQLDFPVRRLELYLKPLLVLDSLYQFSTQTFHGPGLKFLRGAQGFMVDTLYNVPAYETEPRAPQEEAARYGALLWYEPRIRLPAPQAWRLYAMRLFEQGREETHADRSVTSQAKAATVGAVMDVDKIRALTAFCRSRVRDVEEDAVGTPPAPEGLHNSSPAETLRRGVGTALDIQRLWIAMASAVGVQGRLVLLPDPDEGPFDRSAFTPFLLPESCVAAWNGMGWTYLNPAERYTPEDGLSWREQGRTGLLIDPDRPMFVDLPRGGPSDSRLRRCGSFTLTPDGTLEGVVTIRYTGHTAEGMDEALDDKTPELREKDLREGLKARLSMAEASEVRYEGLFEPGAPLTISYHVRVPEYATRGGRRLFFEPSFFERGNPPTFASPKRLHPVSFPFAWIEEDSVSFRLPAGFQAEAMPRLDPLPSSSPCEYQGALTASADGSCIVLQRRFAFGGRSQLYFAASDYAPLKQAFDTVNERDGLSVTVSSADPPR